MNTLHKDINKFIPRGEYLRGFLNQPIISATEIHNILKERGIFTLNKDKDYTVPLLQVLLLSPSEFDKIRYVVSIKEDTEKKLSREIRICPNAKLDHPKIDAKHLNDSIDKYIPTCKLKKPIQFTMVDGIQNHWEASFTVERHDINKSWSEQTNEFHGKLEIIKEQDRISFVSTYTAPETKQLTDIIEKQAIEYYKQKKVILLEEQPKKIIFSDFTNQERFIFFYKLTIKLQGSCLSCNDIKDVSIRPQEKDGVTLPKGIEWMEEIRKIVISGKSLNKKFFMKDTQYHKAIILWSIDAQYTYDYKGERGEITFCLGFPEYNAGNARGGGAEFTLKTNSLKNKNKCDTKTINKLKSQLLTELDKQKFIAYNELQARKITQP